MEWFNASHNELPYLYSDALDKIPVTSDLTHNNWKCYDCRIKYLSAWLENIGSSRPLLNCSDTSSPTYVNDAPIPIYCYTTFWLLVFSLSVALICCCCCIAVFFSILKCTSRAGLKKERVTPVRNPDECFPEEPRVEFEN